MSKEQVFKESVFGRVDDSVLLAHDHMEQANRGSFFDTFQSPRLRLVSDFDWYEVSDEFADFLEDINWQILVARIPETPCTPAIVWGVGRLGKRTPLIESVTFLLFFDERHEKLALKKANEAIKSGALNLDDTVNELKDLEAQEINGSGTKAQLDYILARAGVGFLKDITG